jgi:hypothetical protein
VRSLQLQPTATQEHWAADEETLQERFLVKWAGLSHLHLSWETEVDLLQVTLSTAL